MVCNNSTLLQSHLPRCPSVLKLGPEAVLKRSARPSPSNRWVSKTPCRSRSTSSVSVNAKLRQSLTVPSVTTETAPTSAGSACATRDDWVPGVSVQMGTTAPLSRTPAPGQTKWSAVAVETVCVASACATIMISARCGGRGVSVTISAACGTKESSAQVREDLGMIESVIEFYY